MAMIHYLYVGHFVADYTLIKFEQMRPVIDRPLNLAALSDLLDQYFGSRSPDAISAEWEMSVTPEYIICNRYGAGSLVLRFIVDFARQGPASIFDMGNFTL